MNIGNRIKQRRLELDLTADELGDRIGKSRATVYRYENGYIENMPTTVLEPLAEALYTTPAYLMGWEDTPEDWEDIGNEEGIYPSHDYEGSYEDYVKLKCNETKDIYLGECCVRYLPEENSTPNHVELPENIRAAARDMVNLSIEDQKTAIDMINYLSQKGKEAKKE